MSQESKLATAMLGWGGTSGEYLPREGYGHCSISGCGALARMLGEYGYDGLAVIVAPDQNGPMASAWIKASIQGPMLNTKLGPTEVSRFNGRDSIVFGAMVSEFESGIRNSFTNLCAMAQNEKFSGLDEVGIDVYLAVKKTGGARIGKMIGHSVVWDDGAVSRIPESAFEESPASYWEFWDWDKSVIPHRAEAVEVES